VNNLLQQMKERRIWRVLLGYPSVVFVLLQAIEFFRNNYGLDPRFLTVGIICAVALLPAAIAWNWRHGEAGEQPFTRGEIGGYVLALVVAVAASWFYWQSAQSTALPRQVTGAAVRTVAVLPFENPAGDAKVEYLCEGIAESLINWLATVPDIRVISKSASFRLRSEQEDTGKIAGTLGADSLLRGRLELVDGQLVVSASLVDARDESQIWGERLVQPSNRVLELERSIVGALESSLGLSVSSREGGTARIGDTEVAEAYQHYLRGHYLIQSTNEESISRGLEELRAAIQLDPSYARPYADIADSLTQSLFYGTLQGEELIGEARSAAYAAVALAPRLAESHTALANMLQFFEFDWAGADRAYEAAIALEPNSPVPYHRYSDYLAVTLRFERAREMARRALQIDPLDSSSMHALGWVELLAGNFEAAATAFGEWNRYHPGSRWSWVKHSVALALSGHCEHSSEQAARADEMYQGEAPPLVESWLAWSYKMCGNEEFYQRSKRRLLSALESAPDRHDFRFAYLYALEGDTETLVDVMESVYEKKDPLTLFIQIFLPDYLGWAVSDTLPTNPRYLALLDRIGFPPNEVRGPAD